MGFNGKLSRLFKRPRSLARIDFKRSEVDFTSAANQAIGGAGLVARAVLCGVGILAVVMLVYGLFEILKDRFIYSNPDFAIRKVDVHVKGYLSPELVLKWSGVSTGENIFRVDLAAIRRNLEFVPQIKQVTVERVLPNTIRISVEEREPIARILVPVASSNSIRADQVWIDENGIVFTRLDRNNEHVHARLQSLPVIIGISPTETIAGYALQGPEARAAIEIIKWLQRSTVVVFDQLRILDVGTPGAVVAQMASGAEVVFGLDRVPQQVRRLREVYELGRRLGRQLMWVDLSVTNNLPVSWLPLEGEYSPVNTKNLEKTTPSSRKNA